MDVLRRLLTAARVQRVGSDIGSIVAWPPRRWLVAVAAALLAAHPDARLPQLAAALRDTHAR